MGGGDRTGREREAQSGGNDAARSARWKVRLALCLCHCHCHCPPFTARAALAVAGGGWMAGTNYEYYSPLDGQTEEWMCQ